MRECQHEEVRRLRHEYWALARGNWDRFAGVSYLFDEYWFQEITTRVRFLAEKKNSMDFLPLFETKDAAEYDTQERIGNVQKLFLFGSIERGVLVPCEEGMPNIRSSCNTCMGAWNTTC